MDAALLVRDVLGRPAEEVALQQPRVGQERIELADSGHDRHLPPLPGVDVDAAVEPFREDDAVRQGIAKPPGVPAYETHLFVKSNGHGMNSAAKLLDDAWSCAPQVLAGIADPDTIVPVLNSYCASLLAEGSPHDRDRLVNWLTLAQVNP